MLHQEQELARKLNISIEELPRAILAEPSVMDTMECTNVHHYIYDLPKDRFQIPIDNRDFRPNDGQIYLYRFLMHNYRHQREKAKRYKMDEVVRQKKIVEQELKKHRQELSRLIARCKKEMQKTKRREAWLQDMHARLVQLTNNRVFHNRRTRQYRGLPHLL